MAKSKSKSPAAETLAAGEQSTGARQKKHRQTPGQIELEAAIDQGKRAIFAESYDAEHDALVSLLEALGAGEPPECTCDDDANGHAEKCACHAWQRAGLNDSTPAAGLHVGQTVFVNAHGRHEEDFSGIVVRVDNDNYLVHVEAPDGETYGCTMCFVYPKPEGAI